MQCDTYARIVRAYLFELKPQEEIKRLPVDIGYLDRLVLFTIHNLKTDLPELLIVENTTIGREFHRLELIGRKHARNLF